MKKILMIFFYGLSIHIMALDYQNFGRENSYEFVILSPQGRPKGVIIFIHGGPADTPSSARENYIEPRSDFLKDMANEGFVVIAPVMSDIQVEPGKNLGEQELLQGKTPHYVKLLDALAVHVKFRYPKLSVTLITHSYGGHQGGFGLILGQSFKGLINRFVNLSGTAHHAAGDLRRYMTFYPWLKLIPLNHEGHISWQNGISFNEENVKIAKNYGEANGLQTALYQTNSRYGLAFPVVSTENPLLTKEDNQKLSLVYNAKALPQIPVWAFYPQRERSVTVDTGLALVKAIKPHNQNAFFATDSDAVHNWMKNNMRMRGKEVYERVFKRMMQFIKEPFSEETSHRSQGDMDAIENYLSSNPKVDYVRAYDRMMDDQPVTISQFANEGEELIPELFPTLSFDPEEDSYSLRPFVLIDLPGITQFLNELKRFITLLDNPFAPLSKEEAREQVEKAMQSASTDEEKEYLETLEQML